MVGVVVNVPNDLPRGVVTVINVPRGNAEEHWVSPSGRSILSVYGGPDGAAALVVRIDGRYSPTLTTLAHCPGDRRPLTIHDLRQLAEWYAEMITAEES